MVLRRTIFETVFGVSKKTPSVMHGCCCRSRLFVSLHVARVSKGFSQSYPCAAPRNMFFNEDFMSEHVMGVHVMLVSLSCSRALVLRGWHFATVEGCKNPQISQGHGCTHQCAEVLELCAGQAVWGIVPDSEESTTGPHPDQVEEGQDHGRAERSAHREL